MPAGGRVAHLDLSTVRSKEGVKSEDDTDGSRMELGDGRGMDRFHIVDSVGMRTTRILESASYCS